MTEGLASEELVWLEQFFSSKNSLKWKDIVSHTAPSTWLEYVQPWISAFSSSKGKLPIVLPVFSPDGPLFWYAMVSNDSGAKALSKELTAFIGPSYSNFSGEFIQLDLDDPIDRALKERFGRLVFRVSPVNLEDPPKIAEALLTYQIEPSAHLEEYVPNLIVHCLLETKRMLSVCAMS